MVFHATTGLPLQSSPVSGTHWPIGSPNGGEYRFIPPLPPFSPPSPLSAPPLLPPPPPPFPPLPRVASPHPRHLFFPPSKYSLWLSHLVLTGSNLERDSCPGRDLNHRPLDWESCMLTTRPLNMSKNSCYMMGLTEKDVSRLRRASMFHDPRVK